MCTPACSLQAPAGRLSCPLSFDSNVITADIEQPCVETVALTDQAAIVRVVPTRCCVDNTASNGIGPHTTLNIHCFTHMTRHVDTLDGPVMLIRPLNQNESQDLTSLARPAIIQLN